MNERKIYRLEIWAATIKSLFIKLTMTKHKLMYVWRMKQYG